MVMWVKHEIFVLLRIVASCLTAIALIFFISSLSGEDLLKNNSEIRKHEALIATINGELEGGIAQRLARLGEVPEQNPFRRFYAVELAKEIHDLSGITEKQRMLFDAYNVRAFETQLRRLMEYTERSDVRSLMDELEVIRRELKNSANLMENKRGKLIRQRTAYIVLFVVLWIIVYLYYSRGIILIKANDD